MKKFLVKFVDMLTGKTREEVIEASSETDAQIKQAGIARKLISLVLL